MANSIYDEEQGNGGKSNYQHSDNDNFSQRQLKELEEQGDNPKEQPSEYSGKQQGSGSPSGFSYTGGKGSLKAGSFLKNHKKGLALGGGAILGLVIPILVIALLVSGLFKIPDFASDVLAWQFAKVTNQYRDSVNNVVDETASYDALGDQGEAAVDTEFSGTSMLDTIKNLSPNKILDNLEGDGYIQYTYGKTSILTGEKQLTSITISPNDDPANAITVDLPSSFDKTLHPLRTLNQYKTIDNALDDALKAYDPDMPLVIRSATTIQLLRNMGASLKGIVASKYVGKDQQEADLELNEEAYSDVNGVSVDPQLGSQLQGAAEAADEAEQEVVNNPSQLEQLVSDTNNTSGVPTQVDTALSSSLASITSQSLLTKILNKINPIYALAVPACVLYEGAKITPQSINSQEDNTVREASLVLSTSDQIKDGTSMTASAAGAVSDKLGNIQDSYAIERLDGQSVNTLNSVGGQRSVLGTFEASGADLFDTVFGSDNPFSIAANNAVGPVCSAVTNSLVGAAIGVVNIAQIVASLGAGPEATEGDIADEAAAETSAETALSASTSAFLQKVGGVVGITKTVAIGGGLYAASYYAGEAAKVIVEARDGMLSSGLESGTNFDNNVDDGTNQLSNEVMRTEYYGRPLTNTETTQQQATDQADIAYSNQGSDAFNRYLSLGNPNSLVSRISITVASLFSRGAFASLLNHVSSLFNPVGLASKLLGSVNNRVALADGSQDTEDYGNVQFGYSNQEQQFMQEDTYAPLENELILDKSGKENAIVDTYARCFTESMGDMLTNGDLYRNSNGSITGGLCAPSNLGPDNPQYGDLVFRWRLVNDYTATANALLGVQNPSNTGS
jgi:hypothetical protein